MAEENKWDKLARKGSDLIKKGDFKTAKRVFEAYDKAYKKQGYKKGRVKGWAPGIGSYADGLVICYEKLGEYDKAAERYEELDVPWLAGEMYEKMGEYGKAETAYKEEIDDSTGKTGHAYHAGGLPFEEAKKGLSRVKPLAEKQTETRAMRLRRKLEKKAA